MKKKNQNKVPYEDYCVESIFTDKKTFTITKTMLDKIWEQSLDVGKAPFLVVGVRCNDEEVYLLQCAVLKEKIK